MSLLLSPSIQASAADADKSSRITVIDILRGFALLGMILTHSFDTFWHQIRLEYGDGYVLGTLDSLFDIGSDVFLVRKFFTIFSFLFGLGFAMQFRSAKAKGTSITGRFIWRLLILLLIGTAMNLTIHAGKILQTYAFLGMVLLFSHTWKKSTLLYLAIFFFSINLIISLLLSYGGLPAASVFAPLNKAAVSSPGLFLSLVQVFFNWILSELLSGRLLMEMSLFLFGQYVGRKNVFTDTPENRLLFYRIFRTGGTIALLTTGLLACIKLGGYANDPVFEQALNFDLLQSLLKAVQQPSMSFFYVACIVIAFRKEFLKRLLIWLEPAGKMALTTFIIQAIFILYLGDLEVVKMGGLAFTMVTGILFFILQILFAAIWMTHFRQGPVEWLWRTLTFLKFQPLKRNPSGVSTSPRLRRG